jgi:hypothetical protein
MMKRDVMTRDMVERDVMMRHPSSPASRHHYLVTPYLVTLISSP